MSAKIIVSAVAVFLAGCSHPDVKGTCSGPVHVEEIGTPAGPEVLALALRKRATQDLQRCAQGNSRRLSHGDETVAVVVDGVMGACVEQVEVYRNNVARRYYAADYDVGLTQQLAVEAVADREARMIATDQILEARQGNCR